MLVVKVQFNEQNIRLKVDPAQQTLSTFQDLIQTELHLIPTQQQQQLQAIQLRLKYVDEDQQQIDILSDKHLYEAFEVVIEYKLPYLRILAFDNRYQSRPSIIGNGLRPPERISRHPLASTLLKDISETHDKVAQKVIDWWLTKMPEAYFREIDHETRQNHLRALIALQMTGQKSEISLLDKSKNLYSVIKASNYVGLLSEVISSLPQDKTLKEANIYTSIDDDLVVDVFEFVDESGKAPVKFSPNLYPDRLEQILQAFQKSDIDLSEEMLIIYMQCCEIPYILHTPIGEIIRHFQLVHKSMTDENVVCRLESSAYEAGSSGTPSDEYQQQQMGIFTMDAFENSSNNNNNNNNVNSSTNRLMVVLPINHQDFAFPRIVRHLGRLQVDIMKATLIRVYSFQGSDFVILTFYIRILPGGIIEPSSALSLRLTEEIKRLPFLDDSVFEWLDKHLAFSLAESELVLALSKLAHCLLADEKPLVFTQYHIMQFVENHLMIYKDLIRLLELKFGQFGTRQSQPDLINQIKQQIEKQIELEDCRLFFNVVLNCITNTIKVNLQNKNRLCLILRLQGNILRERMVVDHHRQLPFGIFYAIGRGFQAFHLRFRDIARGGLRIVEPGSIEQYTVSNRSLIGECFSLALGQHLKNKDIPEAGAKAMVLVEPGQCKGDIAVKAFVDGLLDVTCSTLSTHPSDTQDRELVFLGPDENISNSIIEWIHKRAGFRKHLFPSTFMSSKPDAGINHRTYGVISVGLVVFLEVAIKNIGINPREQSFSVKISGGPQGEISGNLILLLHKQFGSNCRIVAISDTSGVAEDPSGLDSHELKRLVVSNLPIIEFSKLKLSHRGHIISVHEGAGSGVKARNTMPFRVESDVFIPTDGKSNSISDSNWKYFLCTDSKSPTSKLIIEGCSMYISPGAKHQLSTHGVLIIPDSTATKGGVICSSYEILAGMLVNEDDFLQIKDRFVSEVIERLRHFCRLECEIIFKEYQRKSLRIAHKSLILPDVSSRISKAIIELKDGLLQSRMLDIYALPVGSSQANQPLQSPSSAVKKGFNETSAFFIESPPSPVRVADPALITTFSDQLFLGSFEHVKTMASEIGFTYNYDHHHLCRDLLYEYVPPSLKAKFNNNQTSKENQYSTMKPWEIDSVIPQVYKKRILATAIACKLVYREGMEFLDEVLGANDKLEEGENMDEKRQRTTECALRYLVELENTKKVIDSIMRVQDLDEHVKQHLIILLEKGGTRISLNL